MSSLVSLCNPIGINEEANFPLKGNDSSDKSINSTSRTIANISTTTGIHGETDGAFHFSNSSYLRSSIFNDLYGNFKTSPYTLSFWAYPTTKSYTRSTMNIIGGWNGSYYGGVRLVRTTNSTTNATQINLNYYDGSTSVSLVLGGNIPFNTWHFIHFSMGDGYRRVGVDDTYLENSDATPDIASISGTMGIGGACGPTATNSGFHYNGKIMGVQAFPKILTLGELEIIRSQKGNLTF